MKNLLIIAAVAILSVACGKVPSSYQGKFTDASKGATLTIEQNKWSLKTLDGRTIENTTDDMTFDNLVKAQASVFTRDNTANNNLVNVFWTIPQASTRGEGGGMVWYKSEVLEAIVNKKQDDAVGSVQLNHCKDGWLMLDTVTKNTQVGCPAGAIQYNMVRAKE